MRVIHCADLHLDSKMTGNLDSAKAKERKAELLNTFTRMVDYAAAKGIGAVLIAGDMFDTGSITALTRNTVRDVIESHSDIDFYYLKGNHDRDSFLSSLDVVPDNLRLFSDSWNSYPMDEEGSIVLTAIELTKDNNGSCYDALVLDPAVINIVMMHGQETETKSRDKAEVIALRELKNKNIDYLALGHIHSYKEESLDARGVYCYPGCLEGRGFDEIGEHGFVVLDIDSAMHTIKREFVPFASRRLYQVDVDVSGSVNTAQMLEKVMAELEEAGIDPRSLVKIVLMGNVDIEAEKSPEYIRLNLEDRFYFVKVEDKTEFHVDYSDYAYDASLKGEYVRMIEAADDIPEVDKPDIIRIGLKAISGEDMD